MLELKKMYTLSVPCITKFIEEESEISIRELPSKLWISQDCTCRISNNSLLIINGLYQAFYSTSISAEYFRDGFYVNKDDFSPGEIQQMIRKKIIDLDADGTKKPHINVYDKCISAYYATLEVTQRCSAFCEHCYNGFERCFEDPSLDIIRERIYKLKNLGIQYIEVTGGEPLLRSDIGQITEYIKSIGLKYCIATNGALVKENINVLLNAESVSISMDGDREYHDKVRGVPLYDKVIEALEILRENKIRTLISMTVTNENMDLVQHVVNIAEHFQAELILAAVVPSGKARGKHVDFLHNEIGGKDNIKIYGDSLKRPKVEINKATHFYGCDMGRKGFTVTINGKILPCLFMRDFSIGSLNDISIDEYNYTISRLCEARRKAVDICDKCDNEKCGGVCIFSQTHIKRRKEKFSTGDDFCKKLWEQYI